VEPTATTFEALYRRELGSVLALAYVLSGSRTAAEELAQESFLAAYRRWDQISTYDQPAAWVRRVCINRSTSLLRRRSAEARAVAKLAGQRVLPDELPPESDAFWRAVRRLPRKQAQAVALRYLDDLSTAETAAVLHCAEATVRVHLHRARIALAAELGCPPGTEGEGAAT
jgi:RNA polymerase sigma-70 factor (ECF subfamily)